MWAELQFLISGDAEAPLKKRPGLGVSPQLFCFGRKFYSKNIKKPQMTGFLIQFAAKRI
jgi:hypothetical protein